MSQSTSSLAQRAARRRGVAAVEFAVVLPILVLLLTVPLFFARYFWHYTVAQKAAQDAVRYLSTVSAAEMRTQPRAEAAAQVAREIVAEEIAELNTGGARPTIQIQCGGLDCDGNGGVLPDTVRVVVTMNMFDHILAAVRTEPAGWRIRADIEMPYVGR